MRCGQWLPQHQGRERLHCQCTARQPAQGARPQGEQAGAGGRAGAGRGGGGAGAGAGRGGGAGAGAGGGGAGGDVRPAVVPAHVRPLLCSSGTEVQGETLCMYVGGVMLVWQPPSLLASLLSHPQTRSVFLACRTPLAPLNPLAHLAYIASEWSPPFTPQTRFTRLTPLAPPRPPHTPSPPLLAAGVSHAAGCGHPLLRAVEGGA